MGFKVTGSDKGKHAAVAIQRWCKTNGFTVPVTEHYFCKPRLYRFDLAWPDDFCAIDIQGGGWVTGHHSRGQGLADDCEKMSLAAINGWRVLLCTHDQIKSGKLYEWIELLFPPVVLQ